MAGDPARPGDPRAALEELPEEVCFELVASLTVGRLAVSIEGEGPLVVPVNYVVHEGTIVFRTDPGTKLDALGDRPASFQVDLVDPFHRSGWSVLIRGVAEAIGADPDLDVAPWAGAGVTWIRLVPHTTTGRRILLPEISTGEIGYL